MPWAGGAGCGQRAVGGAGATTQHGGQAGVQRVVDLLRADVVDVAVKAACRQDTPFARNRFGPRTDDDVHAGLGVGIARLADLVDAPVPEAHVRLVDAGMVHDQRVGDDRIHCPRRPRGL